MQTFLAFWVVIIAIGIVAGFALGTIDYFVAEIGESSNGTKCWNSISHEECYIDRYILVGLYPSLSFFITVPGYILIRSIVGSFKIVFRKQAPSEE